MDLHNRTLVKRIQYSKLFARHMKGIHIQNYLLSIVAGFVTV